MKKPIKYNNRAIFIDYIGKNVIFYMYTNWDKHR